MDLAVDDARKDVQAPAIDPLAGRGGAEVADLGDAPVADADVALARAIVVDDGSVRQNEIEIARHGAAFSLRAGASGLINKPRACKRDRGFTP